MNSQITLYLIYKIQSTLLWQKPHIYVRQPQSKTTSHYSSLEIFRDIYTSYYKMLVHYSAHSLSAHTFYTHPHETSKILSQNSCFSFGLQNNSGALMLVCSLLGEMRHLVSIEAHFATYK